MATLSRMHDSTRVIDVLGRRDGGADALDPLWPEMREWRQRTVRQCRARDVALHWNVAAACCRIRLPTSDLLHVSGLLQQLVADAMHTGQPSTIWVDFGCAWGRLTLLVEDDGGDSGAPAYDDRSRPYNVEYMAAQAAGTVRRRSRGRHRASIFWLGLISAGRDARLQS